MDRQRRAWRTYWLIIAACWVLFLGMGLAQVLTGLRPTPRWLVGFGCLVIALGAHHVYFAREDSAMYKRGRARIGLETESHSPAWIRVSGVGAAAIGAFMVIAGLMSRA